MANSDLLISAEIVLKPASGAVISGDTQITSKNIREFLPAEESVMAVTQFFRDKGFDVFSLGGINLTISATLEQFSTLFGTDIELDDSDGLLVVGESGERSQLLPLEPLPGHIREQIVAVTFVPPPDFGPTNFGP